MANFSLLGLNITARREAIPLELADIDAVNEEALDYIRNLPQPELESRLSTVIQHYISDTAAITRTLETHGIVIIPDFLAPEKILAAETAMTEARTMIRDFQESGESVYESDGFLIQKGGAKVAGYKVLANYPKTVIQIRQGQDKGMVDIFNIDHLFPEFRDQIRPTYESGELARFMSPTSAEFGPKNLNLYLNSAVQKTRGFHVDAYKKQLKSFIYLTDVSCLDDGPYTYVRGSHIGSSFRRVNKVLSGHLPNKTEFPVVPLRDIIPVLASKGSLVISDQGGAHRGFPQGKDNQRIVSVMNYA